MDSIQNRVKETEAQVREFDKIQQDIIALISDWKKIEKNIKEFYVYDSDVDCTDRNLILLGDRVRDLVNKTTKLVNTARDHYKASQVPLDLAQELTNVELLSENISGAMEGKEREFKKARTVRSDYLTGVDAVQIWIQQAELKLQDRTIRPLELKQNLQQIQLEIDSVLERFDATSKCADIIIEKSRDDEEKINIKSTIDTLKAQLQQVKNWLDEKKQQIGDTLDSWTRFMQLYETVMIWVREKQEFMVEPLNLVSLHQARQKLNDYSVSILFI